MGLMIESLYTSLSQHSRDDYNVSSLSLCGDNRWAQVLYQSTVISFVRRHLPYYLKYLQLFSEKSNYGRNIIQVFSRILRLIIGICGVDLAPNYDDLIACILILIKLDPKAHSYILSIFSDVISTFSQLPQQNDWLAANFADFNKFIVTKFAQTRDPDLIRHFVEVQSKVLKHYTEFYVTRPEFVELMNFFFEIIENICEYQMLKELFTFMYQIFSSPIVRESKAVSQLVPRLIGALIYILPDTLATLLLEVNKFFLK